MSDKYTGVPNGEYYDPGIETIEPAPMHIPIEYCAAQEEYTDPGEEVYSPGDELFVYRIPANKTNGKKNRRNGISGYLLAAVLATTALTAGATIGSPYPETATDAPTAEPTYYVETPSNVTPRPEPSVIDITRTGIDYSFLNELFGGVYTAVSTDHFIEAGYLMENMGEDILAMLKECPDSGELVYDGVSVKNAKGYNDDYLMRIAYSTDGLPATSMSSSLWFKFITGNNLSNHDFGYTRVMYYSGGQIQTLRGTFSPDVSSSDATWEAYAVYGGQLTPFYCTNGAVSGGHFTGAVTFNQYPYQGFSAGAVHSLSEKEPEGYMYYNLRDDGCQYLEDIPYMTSADGYVFELFETTNAQYYYSEENGPELYVREFFTDPQYNGTSYKVNPVSAGKTKELFDIKPLAEMFVYE